MRDHSTSTVRRTGLAALVGVLALFGGALTACSSDDDASEKSTSDTRATTTTKGDEGVARQIADQFSGQTGLDLDDADALCFGEAMAVGFGDDRAIEVFESSEDLTELPEADQTIIREAFNECVPGSAVAEAVAFEFYSSAGASAEPDAETVTCIGGALDGSSGDALWESFAVESTDAEPELTIEALEQCVPTEVRAEMFAAGMGDSGLPEAQVQCISNALAAELTLAELVEIGSSPEISPEFEARITAASAGCA